MQQKLSLDNGGALVIVGIATVSLACGRFDFQLPPDGGTDGGAHAGDAGNGDAGNGDTGDAGDSGVEIDRRTCPASNACTFECRHPICEAVCAHDSTCRVSRGEAETLSVQCSSETSCDIDAVDAVSVEVDCTNESSCRLDCSGSADCRMSCMGSARCQLDCGDAVSCTMRCNPRAACLVACGRAGTCDLSSCPPEDRVECTDGTIACRRACP